MWRRWRAACGLAVLAFACEAVASPSESLAPLLACRGIADAAARLACFDREAATLAADAAGTKTSAQPATAAPAAAAPAPGAASPSVAAPAPGTASPSAAAAKALQNFGLPPGVIAAKEVAAGQRPADLSRIEAHVTELSRAGDGRLVLTLDNGQIWLQVLAEGDLLLRPGDAVTISRGVFHSYTLQTRSKRSCKVTRIR